MGECFLGFVFIHLRILINKMTFRCSFRLESHIVQGYVVFECGILICACTYATVAKGTLDAAVRGAE